MGFGDSWFIKEDSIVIFGFPDDIDASLVKHILFVIISWAGLRRGSVCCATSNLPGDINTP